MLSTTKSLFKKLVYFIMPTMVESVSGALINAINLIMSILFGGGSYFFPLILHQYALNMGQFSLDLILNIINSGELGPLFYLFIFYFLDNRLKRPLLLAAETYLVSL